MSDFYTLCLVFLLVIVFGVSIALTAEVVEKYFSEDD